MEEIWKSIKNYEGLYEVSNSGKVRSLKRLVWSGRFYFTINEKILKPGFNKHYYQVHLCKDGNYPLFEIARLVADAFIPNPENKPEVNHKNGIKTDNYDTNLEWNTESENQFHAYKIGLKSAKGSKNGRSKLKELDIEDIRYMYNTKSYTHKELGEIYNVTQSCIGLIIRNKRWNYQ